MRRTKILVTLGPAVDSKESLKALLKSGMNVARCNFSHGDHKEHLLRINKLREVSEKEGYNVAVLMDTKGPEIRTGEFTDGKISLKKGETVELTTKNIKGNNKIISVSYKKITKCVKAGTEILLDDGLITLQVIKILSPEKILCSVENSGEIKDKRGVNIPNFPIDLPNPTARDKKDIVFAVENNIDFIAISFVQNADVVLEYKKLLRKYGGEKIQVIAKIENSTGLKNFDSILNVADGIMVARGDLGVELPLEEVPIVQKQLIQKCFTAGKPVITATQLLHSMINNPRPTRAEVSDIANAIYDLTSAVMLSGETAIGNYAVKCVDIMSVVAERAEKAINYRNIYVNSLKNFVSGKDVTTAVTNAALTTAYEIGAKAIVTVTETGYTARLLSKLRPRMPIIAITSEEKVYHQLSINWGVFPVMGKKYKTLDEMHECSVSLALKDKLIEKGDIIVIVAGIPVGISGATNLIKVEIVGDILVKAEPVTYGRVTGRICIGNNIEEFKLNFKKSDIVVIKYLDENYLTFLKQASAIIIEDNDIEGKAALIGKTLDIPIIKRARAATDILKNGTTVKVDAYTGKVFKI
ncbi:MAG: pyruvate kinase [Candidatus Muiribacteriota bacterium]